MPASILAQSTSEGLFHISLAAKLLLSVLSGILIFWCINIWSQWRQLAHVPGPFLAGFTKLWMVRQSLNRRQPYAFKAANEQYGSLVRVGPNEVITNDPEVLRRVMAVRSSYTRGNFYNAMKLDPTRDNLFSMRDEIAHTKLRAKMAAGYSGKENESMETTVDTQIAKLVDLIDAKYVSTPQEYRSVDIGEKTSFFTLDVISDLAFGKAFGFLETDTDVYDYLKITEAAIPFLIVLGDIPELATVLQSRLLRRIFPSEADKVGFGAFIGIAKTLVAKRFKAGAEPRFDMLGSFIRHGLTEEEAAGEALLQIVAGSDTSAGTIRAILLNLLTSPGTYKALQLEIDSCINDGNVSSPVTDAEARKIPYLQAVIKEGLRILPPASGAMFKQVPAGGDVITGKYLPGGTQIGGSPLGIQHSKHIYGPDADMFRPERWTEVSAEKLAYMTSTVDLCFHYGKFHCLGKPVALMEFNKIFVELFRRFDLAICRPDRPAALSNGGFWMMEDFQVRIERRVDRC